MLVKDIMNPTVDVIHYADSVQEAARRMAEGDYGSLPVEKDDKMVGMITDRDITLRVVAPAKDPQRTTVEEVMSGGVNYCFEDDDVDTLAHKMQESRYRRIPVVNRDKRLVGIVSLGDLATGAHNKDITQETLEEICRH